MKGRLADVDICPHFEAGGVCAVSGQRIVCRWEKLSRATGEGVKEDP